MIRVGEYGKGFGIDHPMHLGDGVGLVFDQFKVSLKGEANGFLSLMASAIGKSDRAIFVDKRCDFLPIL